MRSAVLAVDCSIDFFPGGALGAPGADRIIRPVNKLMAHVRGCGWLRVASRDWHSVKTAHFDKWPPHCVQGTEGAKFHPDLDLDGAIIISKGMGDEDDYSPFRGFADDGRSLEQVLRDEEVGRLYVFGLVTEVCDKAAVLDALELGFEVCFVVDASCALDSNPGDGDAAIAEMVAAGAHVTTVDQTIAENQ